MGFYRSPEKSVNLRLMVKFFGDINRLLRAHNSYLFKIFNIYSIKIDLFFTP
jgi:hypothetical protein